MSKKLRLGFSSTFGTAENYFTWALKQRYDLEVVSPNECDYLIFGEGNTGSDHYNYKNCKRILYTGENYRPNYFTYDHAITFDHENSNKHYRLPLWVLEIHQYMNTGNSPYLDYLNTPRKRKSIPSGFCSFVQSNPNMMLRNNFVKKLSEYKTVDCGGPLMNNIGYVLPRDDAKHKKDFINDRKFNIAFENGIYPGYCTEKILDALYADTIPIYLGSNTVDRDFNSDRFINTHTYNNLELVIGAVKELDADDKKWLEMVNQPVWKGGVMPDVADVNNFLDWWETYVE